MRTRLLEAGAATDQDGLRDAGSRKVKFAAAVAPSPTATVQQGS